MCAPRSRAILWVTGLLAVLAPLCPAQSRSPSADQADFEKVCGACHNTSLVSDIRTEPEWEETIENMVSVGANASAEQLKAVMRVLLRTLTRVNINTASAAQLPLVLDISDTAAQALVKYRRDHGDFKTLEDLKKVPGMDPAKLEERRNRIVF